MTTRVITYELSCQKVKLIGKNVRQCGNVAIETINRQRLCHNCLAKALNKEEQ